MGSANDVANGTLFNNHDSTADYWIVVMFNQSRRAIGSANDGDLVLNTNNEAPFVHNTWHATLNRVPPGPISWLANASALG